MKTIDRTKLVKVAVAALILSMPGLALASPISSRDITTSASTITNSVVAATRNQGLATGPVVSSPTENTPCATSRNEVPAASDSEDPILEDARKGVDANDYFAGD